MATRQHPVWNWLPTVELLLAVAAGGVWYTQGGWAWYAGPWPGPWPLVLLAVMVGLTVMREGRRAFRPTPLTLPLLVFLGTAGVALRVAYDPAIALAKAWLLIAAVGVCWALAHQPDVRRLLRATGFWALFAAGVAAFFLITNDWDTAPVGVPMIARVAATLRAVLPEALARETLNENVAGGMVALGLPFFVPLFDAARRARAGWRRLLLTAWALALGTALLGLALTFSRGAWLAVAGAGGLWAIWRLLARLGRWRVAIMGALIAGGGLAAIALGWAMLGGHIPGALGVAAQAAVANRLRLLRLGMLLARDTPFTGIGLGMFEMPFSAYTLLIHVGYLEHSHNMVLDMVIEQGMLGAVAFGVLTGTGYRMWESSRLQKACSPRSSEPGTGLILESALASLTVLLFHGLVDDALYGTRGVLVLLVPLGVVAACYRLREDGWREGFKRTCAQVVFLTLLTAVGIGCIVGIRGESGRAAIRAAWYANLGALAQARAELTVYDQHHFNDPTLDEVRREEDLTAALAHFERAVALNPANPTAQQRTAEVALARGAYDAALTATQTLWDAGHRDRVTRLLYGDALVAMGRADEAVAVVQGLEFAQARLLGQAWSRYHLGGDAEREAIAREAAALVEDID